MPPKPFKPPRPSASTSTTKKPSKPKTGVRKSTSKAPSKTKPRSSGTFNTSFTRPRISASPDTDPFASSHPSPSNSHPSPSPSNPHNAEMEDDDEDEDAEEEVKEHIPPELLTRLLHENFKEEGTRISRDANEAVGKYVDTFVRETLARAAFGLREREGGEGGGFMEVEDLEKLAPQLLLDF